MIEFTRKGLLVLGSFAFGELLMPPISLQLNCTSSLNSKQFDSKATGGYQMPLKIVRVRCGLVTSAIG